MFSDLQQSYSLSMPYRFPTRMIFMKYTHLIAITFLFGTSTAIHAYQHAESTLVTPWGEQITQENAWREYPRPNMVRSNWKNLNGLWQYAVNKRSDANPQRWAGEILVPFAIETPLSGVKRLITPSEQIWYRRTFLAQCDKTKERFLLNFGGVDFRSQVFVNNTEVTDIPHESGNLPFTLDITDYIVDGENELVVSVWDPTNEGMQSTGKQVLKPDGCMYSRSSGIWQTVWTEVVPSTYITGYKVVTDIDKGTVSVTVEGKGDLMNARSTVTVLKDGEKISAADVEEWGKPVTMTISNPMLWSPESPNLYDLRITLKGKNSEPDTIQGYFGMRKIEWRKDEKGVPRFYFNNQKTFLLGTLDQGWWPDGFLTPPSDEAMKYDILFLKDCGFNMMRKHIKIEPLRYYYLCDKLGIILWQDMPSGSGDAENRYTLYRQELKEMVDLLQTFPCITMWVPYNESWGQPSATKTNLTIHWLKHYDPTRLVDGPSGWNDYGIGDTRDMHHYSEPSMFPVMNDRVSVLGEFGGIGYDVPGHLWTEQNWGYVHDSSAEDFFKRYSKDMDRLATLASEGLAASVYTQTTDVERETNGLQTYDRKVIKYPATEFKKIHAKVFEAAKETRIPITTDITPDGRKQTIIWKYTMEQPADNWTDSIFDDSSWESGPAGFGNATITKDIKAARVRTKWETKDIWLRREFEFNGNPEDIEKLVLRVFYDENVDVYLNGIKIAQLNGYNSNYELQDILPETKSVLKHGKNIVAVHATNAEGGAYIDLGFVSVTYR